MHDYKVMIALTMHRGLVIFWSPSDTRRAANEQPGRNPRIIPVEAVGHIWQCKACPDADKYDGTAASLRIALHSLIWHCLLQNFEQQENFPKSKSSFQILGAKGL